MSALEIIDQVPEFASLVALELKKIMAPQEDEISTNEAYEIYGRGWIQKQTERKELHPQFRGNKKVFSRAEIERARAKENAVARFAIKG